MFGTKFQKTKRANKHRITVHDDLEKRDHLLTLNHEAIKVVDSFNDTFENDRKKLDSPVRIQKESKHPTINESNIYYVYTTISRDTVRIPMSGDDNILQDIQTQKAEPVLPGTRVRLHYPMVNVNGVRYMTEANVHPVTGQFHMYHLGVYSDDENGGPPIRYVNDFEP